MPSSKKVKLLKNKYSSFFSNRRDIPEPVPELESSLEKIYPSLSEFFKDSLEEIAPVRRNMDNITLQQMSNDRDSMRAR